LKRKDLFCFLGCVSRAGLSAFAASKFALEAFSDSLRQEMLKWGVFVSVVQPAFVPGKHTTLVYFSLVPRNLVCNAKV